MNNIVKGVIAGFAATVVLSLLMMMKSAMGLMPELDIIAMLSAMMGSGLAMGWVAHFMIGSIVWRQFLAEGGVLRHRGLGTDDGGRHADGRGWLLRHEVRHGRACHDISAASDLWCCPWRRLFGTAKSGQRTATNSFLSDAVRHIQMDDSA
jgi:hypothetical protein